MFWGFIPLGLLVFALVLYRPLLDNLRRVGILRGNAVSTASCADRWLSLMSAVNAGEQPEPSAWEEVFRCAPATIELAIARFPTDPTVIDTALSVNPHIPLVWVLKGDLLAQSDWMSARTAFDVSVQLDPDYGLGWCRLGRAIRNTSDDLNAAVDAYLNCCAYGDPGSNGCYGAGRVAEQLGDPQLAIEYYRMSRWEGAKQRADELEAEE